VPDTVVTPKRRSGRIVQRLGLLALGAVAALATEACGPIGYTVNILEATSTVEEAHQAGAESTAPYEYFYASSYLDKAREEAGRAEYQSAMEMANVAQEYGTRARDLARRRGRESGR
jgi:hypothetical protein